MKHMAFAVSVAVLFFTVAVQAQPPAQTETEHVQQELITLENGWNDAAIKRDWVFLDRFLADDYTGTDFDGNVGTKPQFLDSLKSGESVMASSITDDMKVRIYGNAAVVTGRATTVNEQHKGKDFSGRYRWTDMWVKDNLGRWRCVAEHVSRIAQK